LGLSGAAAVIRDVRIDIAGDHVHAPGCAYTDPDGDMGGWSDGITFAGPEHRISGNEIVNSSDIGIVFFGGRDTLINNNTVRVTAGNYGAFAGIAAHAWVFGNNSGLEITGNTVTSAGDSACGGLHTGIDLGPHMWGGGCVGQASPAAVGNAGVCGPEPVPPGGASCGGGPCQVWNYTLSAAPIVLRDNQVTGAHINYLIEGVDGPINAANNSSTTPQLSDWESARDCDGVSWGPLDFVAHHPSRPGWTDLRVHCER
jgi:parallel beta-helix repeat protein